MALEEGEQEQVALEANERLQNTRSFLSELPSSSREALANRQAEKMETPLATSPARCLPTAARGSLTCIETVEPTPLRFLQPQGSKYWKC